MMLPILVKYKGLIPKKFTKHVDKIIEGMRKKFELRDVEFESIFEGS